MNLVTCPICNKQINENIINAHIDNKCTDIKKNFQSKITFNRQRDENHEIRKKVKIHDKGKDGNVPLAEMMRPADFGDFEGQEKVHTILQGLQRLVPSIILYGPPGCGKTTCARIIGKRSNFYREFTATRHSVQDIKTAEAEALTYQKQTGNRGVIFLDEIHRFTKSQQDVFLAQVEKGVYTLIGATTENPSFRLNKALLSRCRVIQLEKLSTESINVILQKALKEYGLKVKSVDISDEVLNYISDISDGDGRMALNSLELLLGDTNASIESIKKLLMRTHLSYDHKGEDHYHCISALHKSIRGSDDNAALYWLNRMLSSGEDPLYIARRLIRIASEDIGLANNDALKIAVSTYNACQMIGMPECDVVLSHCVTFFARSPKSVEVYKAMKQVKELIANEPCYPVPLHLRNAVTLLDSEMDYGKGYKYNPDYVTNVQQEYLPANLRLKHYFDFKPVKL